MNRPRYSVMKLIATCVIVVYMIPAQGQQAIVHNNSVYVLFRGIPNDISVGLWNIRADSINLEAPHAKLEKYNSNSWYITPDTGYSEQPVMVNSYRRNKLIARDTTIFNLKWSPDAKIYFGSFTGTDDSISKSQAEGVWALYARCENFPLDIQYWVKSFELTVTSNGQLSTFTTDSPKLTLEMNKAIYAATPGTRLTFDKILVKYPDGRIKPAQKVSVVIR